MVTRELCVCMCVRVCVCVCACMHVCVCACQVFDKLQLTSPQSCDGQIRLTPNTETTIRTNRLVDGFQI